MDHPLCEICGTQIDLNKHSADYLKYNFKQQLCVFIPKFISALAPAPIKTRINNVQTSHKYFWNRKALWCSNCSLGFVYPKFDVSTLDEYYQSFYWEARNYSTNTTEYSNKVGIAEHFARFGIRKYDVFKSRSRRRFYCWR